MPSLLRRGQTYVTRENREISCSANYFSMSSFASPNMEAEVARMIKKYSPKQPKKKMPASAITHDPTIAAGDPNVDDFTTAEKDFEHIVAKYAPKSEDQDDKGEPSIVNVPAAGDSSQIEAGEKVSNQIEDKSAPVVQVFYEKLEKELSVTKEELAATKLALENSLREKESFKEELSRLQKIISEFTQEKAIREEKDRIQNDKKISAMKMKYGDQKYGLPLIGAAYADDYGAMKVLICAGEDVRAKCIYGYNALHTVIKSATNDGENAGIVATLTQAKYGGEIVNEKGAGGRTPVHLAVINKRANILRILLESGGKVDAKDDFGKTPLQYADHQGELVALIAQYGGMN